MFGNAELRVLTYMVDHPWWHFPLDLVKAGVVSRWSAVTLLCNLEDYGLVERRAERNVPPAIRRSPPRSQFRTRVVRPLPDHPFDVEVIP